jgi:hypothetical protein
MAHDDKHCQTIMVARKKLGSVTQCQCGVLTLTLGSVSLRFEPAAFHELQALLVQARRRLGVHPEEVAAPSAGGEHPPVH